ncbi:MAG: alkaline phosphatase D family protein, partial [Xanthobacteraceae bacterium]
MDGLSECGDDHASDRAGALFDHAPILEETYGPGAYFLGIQQVAWLKRALANSRATWKVIAADMPIGLIVIYDVDRNWGVEAV